MEEPMNWEAIGAIGDSVGGIGVIVTLLYLTTQIRQNTRAMHSSSFQATTDSLNEINLQIVTNPDLVRVFTTPRSPRKELSAEDRLRYAFVQLSLFRIRETLYFQQNEGTTAFESWSREDVSLRTSLASEATRAWWREAKAMWGFAPAFAAYVEAIITEVERNPKRDV
jgi:hypothetical protein